MVDCDPAQTPMNENMKLSARMSPDTPQGALAMKFYPYSELIRKVLYLAVATRPDIAYVVDLLSRFVESPGMNHWHEAKRVLRYCRGTIHMRFVYLRNPPRLLTTFSATSTTEAVQFVVDDVRCRKAVVDEESSATTFR